MSNILSAALPSLPLPSYAIALSKLDGWHQRNIARFMPAHLEALKETRRRIERLEAALSRLMELNGMISRSIAPEISFDATTGVLMAKKGEAVNSIRFDVLDPSNVLTANLVS